ncbi:MAG: hypothetical protein IPP90_00595 [Gemmatimonadaceae bacterium]|nr:hypothetical protein [Gemmatimonadaceae bacterium]
MSCTHRLSASAISALFIAIPSLQGQGTTRTLSKPEAEYAEPFSAIVAVRELRDGRVLVADTKDKTVQLVDLKAGKATKVGREGSGPGEYGLPMQLVGVPGDSSIIFDPLNSRYLTILPNGKPGSTFRLEDGAPPPKPSAGDGPGGGRGVVTINAPRASDAQGRLYFEGSPLTFGPDGPVASDSAPVMRYDRKTWRYDTVTFVQLPKNSASVQSSNSGGSRNVQVRIGARTPFPARDAWTVLPNGSVVVVRVKDYHVEVIAPTRQVVRGPAVVFTPVKVGEAEKQEFRDSQKGSAALGITRSVENGKVTTGAAPAPPAEEPKEWPTTKPAFTQNGVFVTPAGEIWVLRSRAAKDETPRYDVFSAVGKQTGQVVLPRKTRLIGFGVAGAIYTVRSDEDDLQYLQRFRG